MTGECPLPAESMQCAPGISSSPHGLSVCKSDSPSHNSSCLPPPQDAGNPAKVIAMDGLLLVTSSLEPLQKWALIAAAVLTILYAVMRPSRKRKDPLATKAPVSLA